MIDIDPTILFSGVVAGAVPIVLATLGETISEKAGIINLSLDGSILLSAMTAFAVALETKSLAMGFISASLVGGGDRTRGGCFQRIPSPIPGSRRLCFDTDDPGFGLFSRQPLIHDCRVPRFRRCRFQYWINCRFFGDVFFRHNLLVYFSFFMIGLCWWYIYKTPSGLKLQCVGEYPQGGLRQGV